ncbi:MAG: phage tail protein [Clostridium sp.]|nr:phage tail protein [Clostridium sp.]
MVDIKYFLLNKEEDYIRQDRYICSALLDSGEKRNCWSRICVRQQCAGSDIVRLRVFVSEEARISYGGRQWEIEALIMDGNMLTEKKLAVYAKYQAIEISDRWDCLLDGVSGRYMWLVAEICSGNVPQPFLPEIQIFFQADSWLSLLPQVYTKYSRENHFLFRYLSIFQWIYYDMSQRIDETPRMLYPSLADMEMLEWLAVWFDIDDRLIWNREQMIYLIGNASRLSAIRGTREYMEELVGLFTGYTPFIVEYYQTYRYQADVRRTNLLETLYGGNAYAVTVLLPQEAIGGRQEAAVLRRIIRSAAPADVDCRLVILEPYIYLDDYSYMGINSRLSEDKSMTLNENTLTGNRL